MYVYLGAYLPLMDELWIQIITTVKVLIDVTSISCTNLMLFCYSFF